MRDESEMILAPELTAKIKDYFDLNVYETKVWIALLTKGIASAGEVAQISRVPRSRTYDVLESLEKKGFAIVKLGKPVKYIGIKPRMILEQLKRTARRNAENKIGSITKIEETEEFTQLEKLYNDGVNSVEREDISAALRGKSSISNYLKEVLQRAEKEVMICTSAEDMLMKIKLFQQTFETLASANIDVRVALSGTDEIINKVKKNLKIKIKKINIDAKFFIIDKKEMLFYLSKNNDKEDLAVWINSEFFSQAFTSLFEKALREQRLE